MQPYLKFNITEGRATAEYLPPLHTYRVLYQGMNALLVY